MAAARRVDAVASHLRRRGGGDGGGRRAAPAAGTPPPPPLDVGAPTPAELRRVSAWYRSALLDHVMPFWMDVSVDTQHGGYWTCIDGEHAVYDTDKFVWLQARQVWTLSKLCNERGDAAPADRARWRAAARGGADFLRAHAGDPGSGDGYFALRSDGTPLVAPYNIFSDCFLCMAMAQYYKASGAAWAREVAHAKFRRIGERWANPKGRWSKAVSTGDAERDRSMSSLGLPMIDTNLCLELLSALGPSAEERAAIEARIRRNVAAVLDVHPDGDGLLRENVARSPRDQDTHDGRLFNPGHALECCWFLLEACTERGLLRECDRVVELARAAIEKGWDKEHGGIFYFLDLGGKPPQQLEWDQKLWWVHVEAILCALWCYRHTRDPYWWAWFQRLHRYLWEHFWDKERGGELWGYCRRDGTLLLRLKGGKWKGCFHVPRGLWYAERLLDGLAASSAHKS